MGAGGRRLLVGAGSGSRTLVIGMAVAVPALVLSWLLGSAAFAAQARPDGRVGGDKTNRVIPVSIVRESIEVSDKVFEDGSIGPGRVLAIVARPNQIKARAGDAIKICNKSDAIVKLFSLSPYNRFGEGKPGSGLRLNRGACTTVTVHNPTDKPLRVGIYSEIQHYMKLFVTVSAGCTTVPSKRTTQATTTKCPPPTPKPPAPPTQAASFHLVASLTEVKNPNAPELTIDAAGGTAVWDHTGQFGGAGKGGEWRVDFTFKVPQTLTPGKASSLTLGLTVSNVRPEQPLLFQVGARAPDFKQVVDVHYPNPAGASKTFAIPISASYKDVKELWVIADVVSAEVIYHYRRSG